MSDIANHVTSLKWSKALAERGVRQESYFCYWQNATTKEWELSNHWSHGPAKMISAFLTSELGEMLPTGFYDSKNDYFHFEQIKISDKSGWEIRYILMSSKRVDARAKIYQDTECDARAAMLCHLIDEGVVKS